MTLVFSGVWLSQVIGIGTLSPMGGLLWILFVIVMVFVVFWEIFRSHVQASADVKDSSHYFQGWRFLDRLDSLLSVAPVMVLTFTWLAGRFVDHPMKQRTNV